MKLFINTIWLLSLIFFITSCGMVEGKKEAETVVSSFFDDRIANGGAGKDHFYSDEFFKYTTNEKWEHIKKIVMKANGNLKGYSLQTWNVHTKMHTSQLSGTFVILEYETNYENGSGIEKLTMHKGPNDSSFKILGHRYNSPEIMMLLEKGIENAAFSE